MLNILTELALKFRCAGFELYEVGGRVRDYFLNVESHDIDLATNATPCQIKELLALLPGSIYTIGEKFGTIGYNRRDFTAEITTYRDEVYLTNSRKPEVVFGKSLYNDLSRRDFTINAIARNPLTGEIVDPFNGREDLKNRIIRVVGGIERFDEDPLRMLRAIRFSLLHNFVLESEITHPERIQIISKERIRSEFEKILLSINPSCGIAALVEHGLMQYIIPEFLSLSAVTSQGKHHIKDAYNHTLEVVQKSSEYECIDNRERLILRLAALLHDIGKPLTMSEINGQIHFYSHAKVGEKIAENILLNLKFDNEIISRVKILVHSHMIPLQYQEEELIKEKSIIRLIRKVGAKNIFLLLNLNRADIRGHKNNKTDFIDELERQAILLKCKPEEIASPINGDEIMKIFNLKPSGIIGKIKSHLVEKIIEGELKVGDKEKALALANRYLLKQ